MQTRESRESAQAISRAEPIGQDNRINFLDGLRAGAFLMIFVAHTFHQFAWSIYLTWGVPVFFVLSGFLIGRILLKMRAEPGSLKQKLKIFYFRRALRIFPPYYFVLAVIALAPLMHIEIMGTRREMLWHLFYLTNLLVVFSHGWGTFGVQGHFWSLAVEEQFYLVAPLALLTLPIKSLSRAFLCVWVGLIIFRVWAGFGPFLWFKFLAFAWCDYLLAGIAVAIIEREGAFLGWKPADAVRLGRQSAVVIVGLIGLTLLPSSWTWWMDAGIWWLTPTRLLDILSPLCLAITVAALILAVPTVIERVLLWPPLRSLGRISYACYLWHLFVVSGLEKHLPVPALMQDLIIVAAGLPMTIGIALLSWHFLELPLLRRRDKEFPVPQFLVSPPLEVSVKLS